MAFRSARGSLRPMIGRAWRAAHAVWHCATVCPRRRRRAGPSGPGLDGHPGPVELAAVGHCAVEASGAGVAAPVGRAGAHRSHFPVHAERARRQIEERCRS